MVNKKVVFAFVFSLVLIMSIAGVYAYNLPNWVKSVLGSPKITGNPIYDDSSDGLVSIYHFQEQSYSGIAGEVVDSAAGNNDGTASNGAQIANSGIDGKSLSLDGLDDYVSFSNSYQGFNMSGKDMTMSVWVYRTGAGYYDRIFSRYYNAGMFGGYAIGITNANKVWYFTGNGTTGGTWDYSNGNILSGAWYHIAVTQSGNYATLYIDGVKDVSWTKQRIAGVAPSLTQIGGLKSAYLSFNGSIDELLIYNKTLSASEVSVLYNNQKNRISSSGGGGGGGSKLVNGVCGATNNSCVNGTFFDISDNSTHYLWKCNGVHGGTDASCSLVKGQPTCVDSDGGLNPYVKGTYQTCHSDGWCTLPRSDACLNANTLREAYCENNIAIENFSVNCPNGCSDGACLQHNPFLGTPISSCQVINQPGNYYLNNSLIMAIDRPCINITSSNVEINGVGNSIIYSTLGLNRYAINARGINNVTLVNININNPSFGVNFESIGNSNVQNLSIEGCSGNALMVRNSSGVLIEKSRIQNCSGGIYFEQTRNSKIKSSFVNNNWGFGITLVQSQNNSIKSNGVFDNVAGIVIEGYSGEGSNDITENYVNENNGEGIKLLQTNGNYLANNIINENIGSGLFVLASANNTINNNTICSNLYKDILCMMPDLPNTGVNNQFNTRDKCIWADNGKRNCSQSSQVCSSLINKVKNPQNGQNGTGKNLNWNSNYSGTNWINGREEKYTTYSAGWRWNSPEYNENQLNYYYVSYDIQVFDNKNVDLSEIASWNREDPACKINSQWVNDGESFYYVCNWNVFNNRQDLDNYQSQNRQVFWYNGNVIVTMYLYYGFELSDEQVARLSQQRLNDLINNLMNNQAERVDWSNFNIDWPASNEVYESITGCSSDIKYNWSEDNLDWSCKMEPVICPEYGYQKQICTARSSKGEIVKESSIYCNPGICSGCYVPRILGYDNGENICIPYGTRLQHVGKEFITLEEGYEGREDEGTNLTIYDSKRAHLKFWDDDNSNHKTEVRFDKDIYIGYTYELYADRMIRFTIRDIVPSSGNNVGYINIELLDGLEGSYDAFCKYDGQIYPQRGDDASCQNDYECSSGECRSGQCVNTYVEVVNQAGFLVKILCRLVNFPLLGGTEDGYQQCLIDYSSSTPPSGGGSGGGGGGGGTIPTPTA